MRNRYLVALLLTACCVANGAAQDKPTPPGAGQGRTQARVTVVISRQMADKKISSLPYVFGVTAGEQTNLRMGSDVPIASKSPAGGAMVPQVSYRSVGTNIDCRLDSLPDGAGVYRMMLAIEDSSVHLDPAQKTGNPAYTTDLPSFRTFKTNFYALLRDGQTMQHTSATDPVSGEVMKIDVTMNLLK